ncbi:Minor extracellular protease vpr [Colletotrichum siamense]|uniref:Minor extracellular protease vpr n=1 Tax=Colletotrichum siamense TaxID=690259 RepID=UPI001872FEA2|nr:Minor extracellular protease vpr [Colletotrichum siamense]KAF5495352.1 Minor extracellular protease vpr [Colletotrichum siamense]
MRASTFLTALCLLGSGVASRVGRRDNSTTTDTVIPNRFILQLADAADVATVAAAINARPGARVVKEFNSPVFKAVSIESNTETTDSLSKITDVDSVWPSRMIKLDPSPKSSLDKRDAAAVPFREIHKSTGVYRLHEAGILGEGAKVAVVDTGIYYDHPALGGGFGPGFKVEGGRDLVGDGSWPNEPKNPDDDIEDFQGHGTHVAGIVAGETEEFKGVAPKAKIYGYKVMGARDYTDDETLIEAFLAAYDDDVDVITASIGGPDGWPDSAWQRVCDRIAATGIVITIAAGNSGWEGAYHGSSGSSAKGVIAVASTEASVIAGKPFNATFTDASGVSKTFTIGYMADEAFPETLNVPIVPLTLDTTSEIARGCQSFPAGTPSFTNKIILLRAGGCQNLVKQANARAVGAQYVLTYNDESVIGVPFNYESATIGTVSGDAGHEIINVIKNGGKVTGDFSLDQSKPIGILNPYGNLANDFTSIGALNDLSLKPDIAGPGGDVFSSYLSPPTWAILSGTSMATPYLAGVAALYIGKFGGKKAHGAKFSEQLMMRIISSGEPVQWSNDINVIDGFTASVAQVGTGLVNASKVLDYTTQLSLERFALNDTANFIERHTVEITNNAAQAVTYTFAVEEAGGFDTLDASDPTKIAKYPLTPQKMVPDVTLPQDGFSVGPGETKTAEFIFKAPGGLNAALLPTYSGNIAIKSSVGEHLAVPYLGLAADLQKEMHETFEKGTPTGTKGPDGNTALDATKPVSFTFDLSTGAQDFPRIAYEMLWGTKALRWDIFEAGWDESRWTSYPPVVGENGYVGTATGYRGSPSQANFDPARDDKNWTVAFPLVNIFRTSIETARHRVWWLGGLGDGTDIKPGNYTMRFAALNPLGDPAKADHWDVYEVKEITVVSSPHW